MAQHKPMRSARHIEPRGHRWAWSAGVVLLATGLLSGCSGGLGLPSVSDLNPFGSEEEARLPGKREPILTRDTGLTGSLSAADETITLAARVTNGEWTQPGGAPNNVPGHLELSATPRRIWSADAGSGSSSEGKLIASPIVMGGRVFTLDSEAQVSAFSASGGSQVWRTSLVPENEDEEEGFAGGIAGEGGRIYAATGFGTVAALDAGNGTLIWSQKIGIPIRSSPTVANGKVFVLATDGRVFAMATADGATVWRTRGVPQTGGILANTSPAYGDGVVIVPYPSGEIIAYDPESGNPLWTDSLARSRSFSAFTSKSDAARPVIDGDTVIAAGHAGRLIAAKARTGERLWSQNVGGIQMPYVAGNVVYVVDTTGRLLAISRDSGDVLWVAQLPGEGRWFGPVLAGDQVWVASSKGKLVALSAKAGTVNTQQDLGDEVFISPIVAGGQMYVLTDSARLLALR